jgi:16S rRNA (cytidine1402-2'-O)-methyltransferase
MNEINSNKGKLFICATPIGNLDDVSFRLLETLRNADIIISEDTRTTRKLLTRFEIKKHELQSYHDNSSLHKSEYIIENLKRGKKVAMVSESGTPLISDPGYKIVKRCIDEKIPITVIPGPNAAISALTASGLAVDKFLFIGFLPKQQQKMKSELKSLKELPFTIIFYESPNRLLKLLKEILEVMGDRNACIAREITKIYEEFIRGKISWLIEYLKQKEGSNQALKGEIVLLVEGKMQSKIKQYEEGQIKDFLSELVEKGFERKEAFKKIMEKYDIDKKTLYDIYTRIEKNLHKN